MPVVFQGKLLVDALKDLVLSPLSLIAVVVDLLDPPRRGDGRFATSCRSGGGWSVASTCSAGPGTSNRRTASGRWTELVTTFEASLRNRPKQAGRAKRPARPWSRPWPVCAAAGETRPMKRLIAPLLVLSPLVAFAYPIDVSVVSQGLDVSAESVEQDGSTIIHLINHEPVELRCSVNFNAGVESRRRNAIIGPGKGQTMQFSPRREVVRMRVRVECSPTSEGRGLVMKDYRALFQDSHLRLVDDRDEYQDFLAAFYQRFVAASPKAAAHFEGTDMVRQRRMLAPSR